MFTKTMLIVDGVVEIREYFTRYFMISSDRCERCAGSEKFEKNENNPQKLRFSIKWRWCWDDCGVEFHFQDLSDNFFSSVLRCNLPYFHPWSGSTISSIFHLHPQNPKGSNIEQRKMWFIQSFIEAKSSKLFFVTPKCLSSPRHL